MSATVRVVLDVGLAAVLVGALLWVAVRWPAIAATLYAGLGAGLLASGGFSLIRRLWRS